MTFTPTATADGQPTTCRCCGRHARGIGVGGPKSDPGYLCGECILLVEEIRKVRRPDVYELQARKGGMDVAGPLVEEFGPDLSAWEEEQVLRFCGAIWFGCADRLRELIKNGEAPF